MAVREWVEYEYRVVTARSLEEVCEQLRWQGPVRIVYVEKCEEQHYDKRVVVYKAVVEREIRIREEVGEVAG